MQSKEFLSVEAPLAPFEKDQIKPITKLSTPAKPCSFLLTTLRSPPKCLLIVILDYNYDSGLALLAHKRFVAPVIQSVPLRTT